MSSSNDMYKLKIGTRVASVAITAGLVFAGGAQQVHAQERITHPLADKTDVIASSQSKELKGNLDAHIASPSAVNPSTATSNAATAESQPQHASSDTYSRIQAAQQKLIQLIISAQGFKNSSSQDFGHTLQDAQALVQKKHVGLQQLEDMYTALQKQVELAKAKQISSPGNSTEQSLAANQGESHNQTFDERTTVNPDFGINTQNDLVFQRYRGVNSQGQQGKLYNGEGDRKMVENKTFMTASIVQKNGHKYLEFNIFFNNDGQSLVNLSTQQVYTWQIPYEIADLTSDGYYKGDTVTEIWYQGYKRTTSQGVLSQDPNNFVKDPHTYGNVSVFDDGHDANGIQFSNTLGSHLEKDNYRRDTFHNLSDDSLIKKVVQLKGVFSGKSYGIGIRTVHRDQAFRFHALLKLKDGVTDEQIKNAFTWANTASWGRTTNSSYVWIAGRDPQNHEDQSLKPTLATSVDIDVPSEQTIYNGETTYIGGIHAYDKDDKNSSKHVKQIYTMDAPAGLVEHSGNGYLSLSGKTTEKAGTVKKVEVIAVDSNGNEVKKTFTIKIGKLSDKYNPVGQDQSVSKDEVPSAEKAIGNKDVLPSKTTYAWVGNPPKTDKPGTTVTGKVKVTYPDGSSDEISVNVKVKNELASFYPLEGVKQTYTVGDSLPSFARFDAGKEGYVVPKSDKGIRTDVVWSWQGNTPTTTQAGVYNYTLVATYKDGSKTLVTVPFYIKPKAPQILTSLTGIVGDPTPERVKIKVGDGFSGANKPKAQIQLYRESPYDGNAYPMGKPLDVDVDDTGVATLPEDIRFQDGKVFAKTIAVTPSGSVSSDEGPEVEATPNTENSSIILEQEDPRIKGKLNRITAPIEVYEGDNLSVIAETFNENGGQPTINLTTTYLSVTQQNMCQDPMNPMTAVSGKSFNPNLDEEKHGISQMNFFKLKRRAGEEESKYTVTVASTINTGLSSTATFDVIVKKRPEAPKPVVDNPAESLKVEQPTIEVVEKEAIPAGTKLIANKPHVSYTPKTEHGFSVAADGTISGNSGDMNWSDGESTRIITIKDVEASYTNAEGKKQTVKKDITITVTRNPMEFYVTTTQPRPLVEGTPIKSPIDVITSNKRQSKITPVTKCGLTINEQGKLTGTPVITDWTQNGQPVQRKTVDFDVTVTFNGQTKTGKVSVIVLKDADKNGIPDEKETHKPNSDALGGFEVSFISPKTPAVEHKSYSGDELVVSHNADAGKVTITSTTTHGLKVNTQGKVEGTPTDLVWNGQDLTQIVSIPVTVSDGTTTKQGTVQVVVQKAAQDGTPAITKAENGVDPQDGTAKELKVTTASPTPDALEKQMYISTNQVLTITGADKADITITPTQTHGLTINGDYKIVGTPSGIVWQKGEEEKTVEVPVVVSSKGQSVTTKVAVKVLRDTDGDGIPDKLDTDDDNDGFPDIEETQNGGDPQNSNDVPQNALGIKVAPPVDVLEGADVPQTHMVDVVKGKDIVKNPTITSQVTHGLSIDEHGNLVGKPQDIQWGKTADGKDEEVKELSIPITVTYEGKTKTSVVVVRVLRDTDGDGDPDITDWDDDNDGHDDVSDKDGSKDKDKHPSSTHTVFTKNPTVTNGANVDIADVVKTTGTITKTNADEHDGLYVDVDGHLKGISSIDDWQTGETERKVRISVSVSFDNDADTKHVSTLVTVLRDTDGDGIPDKNDSDIDGDGFNNDEDPNPSNKDVYPLVGIVETPAPVADEKKPYTSTNVVIKQKVPQGQDGSLSSRPQLELTSTTVNGLKVETDRNSDHFGKVVGTPDGITWADGETEKTISITLTLKDKTNQKTWNGTVNVTVAKWDDVTATPKTGTKVIEHKGVPENTKVIENINKPGVTITTTKPQNGLRVDNNGNLVGTPKVDDWKPGEDSRVVEIEVKISSGKTKPDGSADEKTLKVQVTIERDKSGDHHSPKHLRATQSHLVPTADPSQSMVGLLLAGVGSLFAGIAHKRKHS